jgi:hypothetical protein
MTRPLDRTTLIRLAWVEALRRDGARQCVGAYTNGPLRCALGLLREVAVPRSKWSVQDSIGSIGALAGLSLHQANEIAWCNDGRGCRPHSFAEIADLVEEWFSSSAALRWLRECRSVSALH